MNDTEIVGYVCDCCTMWYINGDDSSCRGYYKHTHKQPDRSSLVEPGHWWTIDTGDPEDETRDATDFEHWSTWTCDSCGETLLPGSYRFAFLVDK